MSTLPKKYVFVIMPFRADYKNTFDLAIKTAADDCDMYCQRLDNMIFKENMIVKIYNEINKADIIIADLSTKNANVFYELGYAHALNKTVILLTNKEKDIPFDLRQYQYFLYDKNNLKELREQIKNRLVHFTQNLSNEEYVKIPYDLYIGEQKIIPDHIYNVVHHSHVTSNAFEIAITVMNNSEYYHNIGKNKVYLHIDENIIDKSFISDIIEENKKIILPMQELPSLFPNERKKIKVTIAYRNNDSIVKQYNKTFDVVLKVHMLSSVTNIPFKLHLTND
jgi:hypothetical protein